MWRFGSADGIEEEYRGAKLRVTYPLHPGDIIKVEVYEFLGSGIAGDCHTLVVCLPILQKTSIESLMLQYILG